MRSIKYHDTIIIGAGISGLTAGKHLKNDYTILEKKNICGGLSTQYIESGFKFCYGGHYFHFKDKEIVWEQIKKYSKFKKYIKNSKAFVLNKFIPFPVQFHLSFFPKTLRNSILKEIIENKKDPKSKFNNIEDYLKNTFGLSLYKVFFRPFLSKYYAKDLKNLAHGMDKGSIPVPDRKEILDGYNGKRFKSLGYNPAFYYPENSLRSFIENYSRGIAQNIIYNENVVKIDIKNKLVFTENNEYHYKNLINTMPLKDFLKRSIGSTIEKKKINGLLNISTIVTNIVLEKRRKRFHWVYLPDKTCPFYRFGYYPGSKEVVGYLERTVTNERDIHINEGTEPIYKILKTLGIINKRSEIKFISNKYIPISYIVFDKEWKNIVPPALKILKEKNIYSIGRYGSWDYTSMSDDILHSIKTVEEINNGNL